MAEQQIDRKQVLKMVEIVRQNIKNTRQNLHITQDQMATRMGIDLKTYANYEQNITDIPISRLFEIALALGADAALLVSDKDTMLYQTLMVVLNMTAPRTTDKECNNKE